MPMRVGNIAFDCDDVLNVGGFWSETLGRPLDPGSGPAFASIGGDDADRTEPAWYFEKWECSARMSGVVTLKDIPTIMENIRNLKRHCAWLQCLDDRAAGKVKHCYANDRRWR